MGLSGLKEDLILCLKISLNSKMRSPHCHVVGNGVHKTAIPFFIFLGLSDMGEPRSEFTNFLIIVVQGAKEEWSDEKR